jgi:hypothetical protein
MRSIKSVLVMIGLIAFGLQTACMSYKQIEPANVADYGEVRVMMTNDRRESLRDPELQADTLVGLRGSGNTLRIPLPSIQLIEGGKKSVAKTAGLVLGIAATGAVIFAAAMAITVASEPCLIWCE